MVDDRQCDPRGDKSKDTQVPSIELHAHCPMVSSLNYSLGKPDSFEASRSGEGGLGNSEFGILSDMRALWGLHRPWEEGLGSPDIPTPDELGWAWQTDQRSSSEDEAGR